MIGLRSFGRTRSTRVAMRLVLWIAGGVDHVGAFYHPDYRKEVVGFLDANGLLKKSLRRFAWAAIPEQNPAF